MIASLTGRLQRRTVEGVVVDVAGVGYLVSVPLSTLAALPEQGAEISLHIHTSLREDTLSLFGFATEREKDLFLALTGVSGIGPKLALAVLSGLQPDDLIASIAAGDDARLCAIPGVGRKTAGRICLELKDKVRGLESGARPAPAEGPSAGDTVEDVISALVHLGYRRAQAEEAARKAALAQPGVRVEDLVRIVLGELSRK